MCFRSSLQIFLVSIEVSQNVTFSDSHRQFKHSRNMSVELWSVWHLLHTNSQIDFHPCTWKRGAAAAAPQWLINVYVHGTWKFQGGLATTRSKLPSKIRFWNFPWNVFHHFGLTWGLCRVGTNPWVGFQMPHLYKMFGTLIFSRWGGNRKSKAKLECEMFKLLDMLKIAGPFRDGHAW